MKHCRLLCTAKLLAPSIAFMLLAAYTQLAGAPQTSATPTPSELVGIWKVCYEPDMKTVGEIDTGYLVLSPDGTFVRWSVDYLAEATLIVSGTWTIGGLLVRFEPNRHFMRVKGQSDYVGRSDVPKEWTLMYNHSTLVALFDNPHEPAKRSVLLWHDANYGFAKIY
jgi:hypothetical protein